MYSALNGIGGALVQPSNLIVLLAAVGLVALLMRRRAGSGFLGASAFLAILFGLFPGGQVLLYPLEERFPQPSEAELRSAAGIIVLGGAENPYLSEVRDEPSLDDNAARLIAAADLAHRFPDKPLVYTGGVATEYGLDEADVAAMVFDHMGLRPDRYRLEREAASTYGNALESYTMIQPRDAPWILVTSAYHMPRSVGTFRRVGWTVVPYPVGYRTKPGLDLSFPLDASTRLREADLALHEWVGLSVYWAMGRIKDIFPAPQ